MAEFNSKDKENQPPATSPQKVLQQANTYSTGWLTTRKPKCKELIGASLSEPHLDELAGTLLWYIYIKKEFFFLNEQKSRDAAAKKYRYKRSRDK